MPYTSVAHSLHARIKEIQRLKSDLDLIAAFKKTGFNRGDIEVLPEGFANRKPEKGEVYYYYSGPLDKKTRAFCRLMLTIDKVFSKEQIDYISEELGYDVLEYCGSYNCRHKWVKFRGRVIYTPNPTQREIRKLINNGIEV